MLHTIKGRRLQFTAVSLLVLALGLAACGDEPEEDTVAAAPTATIAEVEQVVEPTDEPVDPPPPQVVVMTNTPIPATETPLPTNTPVPTNTAQPTAVPPTAVPIVPTAVPPPPTAVPPTEPPPPPPPPAIGANGLVASEFNVENTSAGTNDPVWFNFVLANSTGSDVKYNVLGVMPKKDGVDRPEWFQQSYGGEDSKISAGGFEWRDRIKLPETGGYTVRLVMCFDGYANCTQGTGAWHSMSHEVGVTIH